MLLQEVNNAKDKELQLEVCVHKNIIVLSHLNNA